MKTSDTLDTKIYEDIRRFFHQRTGNWLGEEKRYLVLHRLASMVGSGRPYRSYEEIYQKVKKEPYGEDARRVITALTTHYSFFFRESIHFNFFQKYLMTMGKTEEEIRVWCGACSTGEEPYSLAISAILCLPQEYQRVKILGTDISELSIEKARKGFYSRGMVKETLGPTLMTEFFNHIGEQVQVKPEVQSLVSFAPLNLMGTYPFKKKFHMIFLRNIFYYMSIENRELILSSVVPLIIKGGYLIIGSMDSAPIEKFKLKSLGNSIYKKL